MAPTMSGENMTRKSLMYLNGRFNISIWNISPITTRVKISQNVDILAKVYQVNLKVKTLSNLTCRKYIYRSK